MATKQFTVQSGEAPVSLREFLAGRLRTSGRRVKSLLDRRNVTVNERPVWIARHRLRKGDHVCVELSTTPKPRVSAASILAECGDVLIADKPPGIVTCGPKSFEQTLAAFLGSRRLRAVHRLDKDTSGCLICCRGQSMFDALVDLFKRRAVTKSYRAIVLGRVQRSEFEMTSRIDGEHATTMARVLKANATATHLGIKIITGRTHQIRRHLKGIGHPVLGDRQYGGNQSVGDYGMAPRQMLHAHTVRLACPGTDVALRTEAPLPKDFRACLCAVGLK